MTNPNYKFCLSLLKFVVKTLDGAADYVLHLCCLAQT
jgi:hypothetical protein